MRVSRDAVASALVGIGGIGEAVTEHPVAARQRRPDHLFHVLAARREHEQRFGVVRHRLREQELPQCFAERRPARLARRDHRSPARGDGILEPRGMRALAGTIDAFQRNETAARAQLQMPLKK